MTRAAFCMVLAAFLLTSCGRQSTPPPSGADGGSQGPVDPYGDPRSYSGDPFAGFLEVRTVELPAGDVTAPDSTESAEVPLIHGTIETQGPWSIQLAACSTEEDAARVAGRADPLTDLVCVVDAEPPWWKVRLGAFPTREAAEALLEEVRAMGYPDAWVVRRTVGD